MIAVEKNSMSVKICGHEYHISGPESREHMIKVAELVDARMREILKSHPGIGPSLLAMMAAINLADEYLKLKDGIKKEKVQDSTPNAPKNVTEAKREIPLSGKPLFTPADLPGKEVQPDMPEAAEPIRPETQSAPEMVQPIWKPMDEDLAKAVSDLIKDEDEGPPKPRIVGAPWRKYPNESQNRLIPDGVRRLDDEDFEPELERKTAASGANPAPESGAEENGNKGTHAGLIDEQTIFDGF
jgi:cell division protein ZapA